MSYIIDTTGAGNQFIISGTGALTIPASTTADRPTGVTGMLRFNTSLSQFEAFDGSVWTPFSASGASGVLDLGGVPAISANVIGSRPGAGNNGALFVSTDTFALYRDNGATWDLIQHAVTGDIAIAGSNTAATLATVNGNVGSFTNATITVNAKGLITAASTGSAGSGTVTSISLTVPSGLTVSPSTITTSGTFAITASGQFAAGQMPALTGDITTSAGAVATSLATVNSNIGSFTNASITVNAKGLITAASSGTVPTTFAAGLVGTPGWAVSGDSDTGLYQSTANTLSISTGGTEAIRFLNTSVATNFLTVAGGTSTTVGSANAATLSSSAGDVRIAPPSAKNCNVVLTGNGQFSINGGAAVGAPTALVAGATVTPNLRVGNNFTLLLDTVTAMTSFANPTLTSAMVGQSGFIIMQQPASGSLSGTTTAFWDTFYKFQGGTKTALTQSFNAVDVFSYFIYSTTQVLIAPTLNWS